MQYKFCDFEYYSDLIQFLNYNKIKKDNIVSIHQGNTCTHHYDNKIYLIYFG